MLLTLTLPSINSQMPSVSIVGLAAPVGSEVPVGGKLLQVMLTVPVTDAHDCPPVSHYNLHAREKVWVRRWTAAAGDEPAVGAHLGLFSTGPDEPLDAAVGRQLRFTIAGIVPDLVGWGDWK